MPLFDFEIHCPFKSSFTKYNYVKYIGYEDVRSSIQYAASNSILETFRQLDVTKYWLPDHQKCHCAMVFSTYHRGDRCGWGEATPLLPGNAIKRSGSFSGVDEGKRVFPITPEIFSPFIHVVVHKVCEGRTFEGNHKRRRERRAGRLRKIAYSVL